jgi:NAD(P)-dependent dehydrogenase (short-subunit alcohol dehydrogenase family)
MAEATTVVVGGDRGIGRGAADELARRGHRVGVVGGGTTDLTDGVAVAAALRGAAGDGEVGTVVVAHVEPAALTPVALAELGEEAWDAAAERTLQAGFVVLREAHEVLPDGARVVLVLPTVAATGVAGLVPLCTAVEGLRVMGKAVARRWGGRRITVNTIEVDLASFVLGDAQVGDDTASAVPPVPVLGEPALPAGSAVADVVAIVEVLAGEAGGALTGALLVADRGQVMQP